MMRRQIRKLAYAAGLATIFSGNVVDALATPVNVLCNPGQVWIDCQIEKAQKIEDVPFGDMLLERACIKLLKSEGYAYCKIAPRTPDTRSIIKMYSLEQAAKALAPKDRDRAGTKEEPVSKAGERDLQKPQPLDAFLQAAWVKLKLLLGGS